MGRCHGGTRDGVSGGFETNPSRENVQTQTEMRKTLGFTIPNLNTHLGQKTSTHWPWLEKYTLSSPSVEAPTVTVF